MTEHQPSLADLLGRYLQQQADAHAAGLVSRDPVGEVVPFEAAPVQPVDPRVAWDDAVAALACFGDQPKTRTAWSAPPNWPILVNAQEPACALAFAAGNFPQLVRHLQPILEADKLENLRPRGGAAISVPALEAWARKGKHPQALLAVGALRLARQFDAAQKLVEEHRQQTPELAWANEEAALAWHRGEGEKALQQWTAQPDSVPVLFNRGMSALFLGRAADARPALQQAIARMPETSGWHHLARLYLALAER